MNNEVISKIRKLLALGTSEFQGEADKAMSKAKELAERAGVDLVSINPFDENIEQETIERKDIELGKRQSVCQRYVNNILSKHFNIRLINSGGRYSGRSLIMVGATSDLQIAEYVQGFLNQEFMKNWHHYQRVTNCRVEERGSHLFGQWKGLDDKLSEEKDKFSKVRVSEIEAEKGHEFAEAVSNKYSLMVVTNKDRVDKAVESFFPKLRKGKTVRVSGRHSESAVTAGHMAGSRISLHRPLGAANGNSLIK